MNTYIQTGIFQQLKDEEVFKKVYTDGFTIAWSDELEIDADNIYAEILNIDPCKLMHIPLYHATN